MTHRELNPRPGIVWFLWDGETINDLDGHLFMGSVRRGNSAALWPFENPRRWFAEIIEIESKKCHRRLAWPLSKRAAITAMREWLAS